MPCPDPGTRTSFPAVDNAAICWCANFQTFHSANGPSVFPRVNTMSGKLPYVRSSCTTSVLDLPYESASDAMAFHTDGELACALSSSSIWHCAGPSVWHLAFSSSLVRSPHCLKVVEFGVS